jgi:serine/threonine protein phosphatase PrpC
MTAGRSAQHRLRYALRSDIGRLRDVNEDSGYAGPNLLAVADGLGGHVGGEIASAAAIDAVRRLDERQYDGMAEGDLSNALWEAVQDANAKLRAIVEAEPTLTGMGTTLTVLLFGGRKLALAQIGDSRAYLLRDGELTQLTHDQTLVQALVDAGRISAEEAQAHPQRSLLLQALDGTEIAPQLDELPARRGDRYLLCSDGLTSVVGDNAIREVLARLADPAEAAQELIRQANDAGGPDNITCVIGDLLELADDVPGAAEPPPAAANGNPR